MGMLPIVVLSPIFGQDIDLLQIIEQVSIQDILLKMMVKPFHVGIPS